MEETSGVSQSHEPGLVFQESTDVLFTLQFQFVRQENPFCAVSNLFKIYTFLNQDS